MPARLPRSVYIHFPWCLKKCPYCDFLSIPGARNEIPHERYANAVIAELEARVKALGGAPRHDSDGHPAHSSNASHSARLSSIFIGGGTPSLWEPKHLQRVLEAVLARYRAAAHEVEISVECNPSSFDHERAAALRSAGVNRISIGVQSLNSERLRFLGRLHDAATGLKAIEAAINAGFERVSADLIYGVAGQQPENAVAEATRLSETGVGHLSAYTLTIEPGTQFGALARQNRLPLLGEDHVADSFVAVSEALVGRGFEHYEVSNFARFGQQAQHNLAYWRGQDYLGLGCGAWGTVALGGQRQRYRNTPAIERYLAAYGGSASAGAPPRDAFPPQPNASVSSVEWLTAKTRIAERLMLGLRLAEGVGLGDLQGELSLDERQRREIERLERLGRLTRDDERLRIPHQHWLLSDSVVSKLM